MNSQVRKLCIKKRGVIKNVDSPKKFCIKSLHSPSLIYIFIQLVRSKLVREPRFGPLALHTMVFINKKPSCDTM